MPKYRIPLSDTEALSKLRVPQETGKDGKPVVKGEPLVLSWNVILGTGMVEVETKRKVKGLEKYEIK